MTETIPSSYVSYIAHKHVVNAMSKITTKLRRQNLNYNNQT